MPPRTPNSVWLLALATSLTAQHREPFAGVVRDAAGAPLAGAQVVCSWSPDGSSLAAADRRETTSDAAGRFAVDLVIGRAYCVYAIGPADEKRQRRVVAPAFTAVGGRTLDLVADRVTGPMQLKVTGASTWQRAGPLALRILVAADAALTDFVIAGDGTFDLPPLPTTQVTVCLLDFLRDVIDSVPVTAQSLTECAFAPAVATRFVVVDADDQPVVGASIQTPQGVVPRNRGYFASASQSRLSLREVAVTAADGTARGLAATKSTMWFVARHQDACSGLAGVMQGERIENGRYVAAAADEPFRLRLDPGTARSAQFFGAGVDVVVHGLLRSQVGFRLKNGGGFTSWHTELTREGDRWTGCGPGVPYVWALGEGAGRRPLRVAAYAQEQHLDLATLRRLAVQVVGADGKPAPFASVGISHGLQGHPVHWTTHLATDAEGRAELRVMDGDCELYAITDDAHGYLAVTDAAVTEARIQLQPLASVRVRVVDAEGRPVVGALVEARSTTMPNEGIRCFAHACFRDPFRGLVSDADGFLFVRVPRELTGEECTAHANGKVSDRVLLDPGRQEPIELKLRR